MFKKLLIFIAWLLVLILLALGCWLVGLYNQWPLWQSAALFAGVIVGAFVLAWLRRRWLAWRLRRRLARPVNDETFNTRRLDADWRAGLSALKHSRLSRFGSPLYVLPWYLVLGPQGTSQSELMHRVAGADPVQARGDEPPVLQWWLLRQCVVLAPTIAMGDESLVPVSGNWRRLLHWMMRTRRREPLNGLVLAFSANWLMQTDEGERSVAGQHLRKRLDELARVYDARIPVYIVLTDCHTLPGFASWAANLGPDVNQQPMGYLNPSSGTGVGEFISDAFNSIVHRMFDLRVLQGAYARPDGEAFALPERMAPLALRLANVLRPAFQATPYAETPLLRGLYLTGNAGPAERGEPDWFSTGLFEQALPAQRHAWQPLERWRHWRRLLRHATVVAWLVICVGIGVFLVHASNVAERQLHAANLPGLDKQLDLSGSVSASLHSLQAVRGAVHGLMARPYWEQHWMPYQRRVNEVQQKLADSYVRDFHQAIIVGKVDPLLTASLPALNGDPDKKVLAAWVQTLVRRINLLNAILDGKNIYPLPAPGNEMTYLFAHTKNGVANPVDGALLGGAYQDYLAWQPNREVLVSERRALQQVLANLELDKRSRDWMYAWVALQGNLMPVRLTDFWNIPALPDQPFIPAALTPAGEQAVGNFMRELGQASGDSALWEQRSRELRQRFQQAGLDAWYAFADAFSSAPTQLATGTARRAAMTTLFTVDDPYRRLIGQLSQVGQRWSAASRPDWMQQAIQADALLTLADKQSQQQSTGTASSVKKQIDVVQEFGSNMIRHLPDGGSISDGLAQLRTDNDALTLLNTYRQGVLATIVPLQQGDGNAMKAAIDIWSFGHDPNVKAVPLIDANTALAKLKAKLGSKVGPRSNVVWQLLSGPLDFTLDYASRSVACQLEQGWQNSVLSAVQGVNDAELANEMLFGDRGQVKAFMGGDVKNFIDQDGTRYQGRAALARTVPLNGQFYAFASLAQLRQVTLAGHQMQSKRSQDEAQALTKQQQDLSTQIAKLEATTASVTLSTVPPQTNPGAHLLPESVTLSLQCASGRITLENLNFPNKAVFPWSLTQCGDTALSIRFADFELNRQWSGARGFIDFLREFSSGQRRYTAADFGDQAASLQQAGVQWIIVTYQQQGQAALLSAFAEADKLTEQATEVQKRTEQLQPGTAPGSSVPAVGPAPPLPQHIISVCMGPTALPTPQPAPAPNPKTKPAPVPVPSAPGSYDVQVGIFSHPDPVRAQLALNGYEAAEDSITLKNRPYTRIRIHGFATRAQAEAAAKKIGQLLKLKPEVLRDGKRE